VKALSTALTILAIGASSTFAQAAFAQETSKRLPEPPPPSRVIAPCAPPQDGPPVSDRAPPPVAGTPAEAFMADNAKQPRVLTLPSGIQYRVLASGDPKAACPFRDDYVKIHYEGSLTNGTVFDSSYERDEPAIFPLEQVIPGYGESLPYMHVGDEWVLYIPPALGYGERGAGGVIPPGAVLVFRIKLLGVLSIHDAEVQSNPAPKAAVKK
jgi:hypothetical protein